MFLSEFDKETLEVLNNDWPLWARLKQRPPLCDWRTWLILGGRGAGKTRTGAEWLKGIALADPHYPGCSGGRVAVIGTSYDDMRDVMIEGESGLLAIHKKSERPQWISSRKELIWNNGTVGKLFSSANPEGLRGNQFGAAWADEVCKWSNVEQTWVMLQFCLRLGNNPRQVVTTTLKPLKLLKKLMKDPTTITVRSTTSGGDRASQAFSRNPVVYRCIRMISEAASSMPFAVRENRAELNEHPLLDILSKPNARQSGPKFLECLYGHLLIAGNVFLTKIEVAEELREIHILDPVKVRPILDEKGWPKSYEHVTGSRVTRYELDEILHLALFNPSDDVNGLSPLSSAHMALDIHNSASNWNKALLDNSARPSGALVYSSSEGENLTDEQFSRLKGELEEGYTGSTRAGRPMLLEGGLDWKAMGYSPRDMDFMQAKNGAAREIALAFGVPPMLLGIPGDNTYSNYQEANRAFWRQTVLPLANKTACDIGNWLASDFGESVALIPNMESVDALASDREGLSIRA